MDKKSGCGPAPGVRSTSPIVGFVPKEHDQVIRRTRSEVVQPKPKYCRVANGCKMKK